MGRPMGPKKVYRYSVEFKLRARTLRADFCGATARTITGRGCTLDSATALRLTTKRGALKTSMVTRCRQNRGKIPGFAGRSAIR
jgi:hypothetical protein